MARFFLRMRPSALASSIWGWHLRGSTKANTGHHHLLIDAKLPPLDEPIPNDFNHLHFGAGQTEATVTLSPGRHTIQLLLGDANHVPHDPPVMSQPITVTVTRTGQ